jgi:hypothetical protein
MFLVVRRCSPPSLSNLCQKYRERFSYAPYRKAIRKRQVWIEPLFGEAKDWHGLRRFRLRTLEKVNGEALLIAAGQNIKRLLTYGQRGPRRPAQVVALRRPASNLFEFYGIRKHRKRYTWRSAGVFQRPDLFPAAR